MGEATVLTDIALQAEVALATRNQQFGAGPRPLLLLQAQPQCSCLSEGTLEVEAQTLVPVWREPDR